MKLRLHRGLLLATATLIHQGQHLELTDMHIDTGSSGTLIRRNLLFEIGIEPTIEDTPSEIRGVGGIELVFLKRIEQLKVGDFTQAPFRIQISRMNYGVPINGILGLDYLVAVGAVLDLKNLELRSEI